MKQLSNIDASFLHLETKKQPMHISGLDIYDPSTSPDGALTYERLLANVRKLVDLLPDMRRKVLFVPFNLDNPYLVDDPYFDLEKHIHRVVLPEPGDWEQLCRLVSHLHAQPLDQDRPLWEWYLIEGLDQIKSLPKGSFAIFTKTHHAVLDGATGALLVQLTHSTRPEPLNYPEPLKNWIPQPPPDLGKIVAGILSKELTKGTTIKSFWNEISPRYQAVRQAVSRGDLVLPKPAPQTRFNALTTEERVFDGLIFDLEEIKLIKKRVPGATINDVLLTIVGGGIRKYLLSKNELPDTSLIAMVPINVREKEELEAGGNLVTHMYAKLGSNIDGPLERLESVREGTVESKTLIHAIGARNLTNLNNLIAPKNAADATRFLGQYGYLLSLLFGGELTHNVVITNVPGFEAPLFYDGSLLVTSYGLGPVTKGTGGLFHSIKSYCGNLSLSFTGDRHSMPDPEKYSEFLIAAFEELLFATTTRKKRKKTLTVLNKVKKNAKLSSKPKS